MRLHIGHHFFGSGNVGDDLMLAGFLSSLDAAGAADVELTCASAFDIDSQRRRFPRVQWLPYTPEARQAAVAACDAWVGVGDSPFQVVVGPWMLDHLAAEAERCRRLGKPMYFIGIGVNEAAALEDPRARAVLDQAVRVWARDAGSAELLAGACDPGKVLIGADLAHAAMRDHVRRRARSADAGGVGYVLNFEDPAQFDPAAFCRLVEATPRGGAQHWLVQEVRPLPGSEQEIFKALPQSCRARLDVGVPAYAGADSVDALLLPWGTPAAVLSSRYHGALIAAWLGARVVTIERSEKMRGLAQQLRLRGLPSLRDDHAAAAALQSATPVPPAVLSNLAERADASCRELLDRVRDQIGGVGAGRALALAGVEETHGPLFRAFMAMMNTFAAPLGLRTFTTWSKIWEYPWLWHAALARVDWRGKRVVDLGSEISPMPWFLATLGARVTLIETDPQWVPAWQRLRDTLGVDVDWHLVNSETLPLESASADAVTSLYLIEHQPDKAAAVAEVARVLRPGGMFALSFDVCEPEMGMTFPEWNGRALTMREFEDVVWTHLAFGPAPRAQWNTSAINAFLAWHRTTAPHHNYVAAAAVVRKAW